MNSVSPPRTVVLIASDLMLGSTVSGAASAAGMVYRCVGNVADAIAQINGNEHVQLLIDLGLAGLDVASLSSGIPDSVKRSAVAYGPHVHTAKLEAATSAGIGRVMSRGQFAAQISQIIRTPSTGVDTENSDIANAT